MALAAFLVCTSPAGAIINGTLDFGHPYSGAVIFDLPIDPSFEPPSPNVNFLWCSATLVSPRVVLTAAHCFFAFGLANGFLVSTTAPFISIPTTKLKVSFAPNILNDTKSWRSVASYVIDPDVTFGFSMCTGPGGMSCANWEDFHDLAVVILAKPVSDISPATLPPLHFLDARLAAGDLKGVELKDLGYGFTDNLALTGDRRIMSTGFLSLYDAWVVHTFNPAQGEGTICFRDSGGTLLFDFGGTEYLVGMVGSRLSGSVFSTDFLSCKFAKGITERVDSAHTLGFILGAIAANP